MRDSGAVACIAEDATQLANVESADLPGLAHRVVMDGTGLGSLQALEERGARWLDTDPDAFEVRVDQVQPADLATLIYTSGTTGTPRV